jgi:integrase
MAHGKKQPTSYPGVRLYEDDARQHRGKPDRYYSIRYRVDGKLREEGLGWQSEGWSAIKASEQRAALMKARRTGDGARTLAEKRDERRQAEQARQEEEARTRLERLTFAEAWDRYFPVAQQNKTKRSWERERDLYTLWIKPVVGSKPLAAISQMELERIKKNLSDQGRSPATIRYALAVIRQVFNYGRRNGLYKGDTPTSAVKFPKSDNRRMRFLSPPEAKKLLDALKGINRTVYEMAMLSLDSGLRRGEIFSLTWADVDLHQGHLLIKDTKGQVNRHAFLTKRTAAMLTVKEAGEPASLVFPGPDNTRIKSISRHFNAAVTSLDLNRGIEDRRQRVVFHSLRHTFASWIAEAGVPLAVIRDRLGHKDFTMLSRYTHVADRVARDTVNILDRLVQEEEPAAETGSLGRKKIML